MTSIAEPARFEVRHLGSVVPRGKQAPVEVLESLDVLPADVRARRIATRDRLERAIEHIEQGRIDEARELLTAVAIETPEDHVVSLYLERIGRTAAPESITSTGTRWGPLTKP